MMEMNALLRVDKRGYLKVAIGAIHLNPGTSVAPNIQVSLFEGKQWCHSAEFWDFIKSEYKVFIFI